MAGESRQNQLLKILEDEVKTLKAKVKALGDRQHTKKRPHRASDNHHSQKPSENQLSWKNSNNKRPDRLTEDAVSSLNDLVIDGYETCVKKPEGSLLAQTSTIFERPSENSASAAHAEWEWDEGMKLLKEKTQRFEVVVLRTRPMLSPASKTKRPKTTPQDQGKNLKTPSSSKNLQLEVSSPYESPISSYGRHKPATGSPSRRNQRTTRTETTNRSPDIQKTARTDGVLNEAASQIRSRPTPATPEKPTFGTGKLEWSTRTPLPTDSPRGKHRRTRYRPAEDKMPKVDS